MKNLIKKHAKSFYWASFFLSEPVFNKCSCLYNFCRTLDDIVDHDKKLDIKKESFLKFKNEFIDRDNDNPIIKEMWSIIDKEKISKKVVMDLFDGVQTDLEEKVKINSKKELLIYSYRVAGTVGLMMSKILKVNNKEALRGAIDLGIAMQLTNIARDVCEDKARNRRYVNHNFSSIKEVINESQILDYSSVKKRFDWLKKRFPDEVSILHGELKQDEFVYVDHLGNFTDTPPDPAEKEEISLESINLGAAKNQDFDEKIQGKVTFYEPDKGFGFIKNLTSHDSYFFHFSECKDTLGVGDKVEFDTVRGEKGLNAVKINKI